MISRMEELLSALNPRVAGNQALRSHGHAIAALAVGAAAAGAVAVGALAIGRLVVGRAFIRRLEIDELVVRRLTVVENLPAPGKAPPSAPGAGLAK